METIRKEGRYSIVKNDNDRYELYKKDAILTTPGGVVADTEYLSLANKLMDDWMAYGYGSYRQATSILSYHFTMVERFSQKPKEEILSMLNSMNWENDWTLQPCPSPNPNVWMQWISMFGQRDFKIEMIRQWLQNQSVMQLVASTCVYNAFMSYNVSYYMAVVVEELPEEKHREAISNFYDFYSMMDPVYDFEEFWKIFECFRLYYGFHLKEEGKHVPQP